MSQNRVEPTIPTIRARTAEEEREGWAFDIAKTVLPAIVRNIGYSPESPRSYPNLAAEIAYEYADALIQKSRERRDRVVAAAQKRADADAFEEVRKRALADFPPD